MMRIPVHFPASTAEHTMKQNDSRNLLKNLMHELRQASGSHNKTGTNVTDPRSFLEETVNTTLLSLQLEQTLRNDSLLSASTTPTTVARDRLSTSWSIISTPPLSSSTTRPSSDLDAQEDTAGARIVFELATPPTSHGAPGSEEALLNRSSVLFVAVSFILLMVISLAWLVFYYVQRFRYLHSKERVSRRLAELAKKAVARIPIKTLHPGDRETNSDLDQCAICIEPFRPLDNIRVLPCRHYFHKLCIDPWLLEQRSCPMCKLDILQAYGLRSEFVLSYPNADSGPVGSSRPSDVLLAASGLGIESGSRSGSDDGMERIALVHSHSRSTLTGTHTSQGLAYMVLTPSTTGTSNALISDPVAVTATGSARYYVRGSDSSDANTVVINDRSIPQPTLQDLPNTAIPLQASAHNIIVSLLPHLPSPSSEAVPSPPSQDTPPGSMVAAWTPALCTYSDGLSAGPVDSAQSIPLGTSAPQTTSKRTECWVYSIPQQLPQSSGVLMASSTSGNASNPSGPEVTSTTQILVSPVCSVRADGMTSTDGPMASDKDGPSDMIDVITPVPINALDWQGNTLKTTTSSTVAAASSIAANSVLPHEAKHSLLHPHQSKASNSRSGLINPSGRFWRALSSPFRPSRSRSKLRSTGSNRLTKAVVSEPSSSVSVVCSANSVPSSVVLVPADIPNNPVTSHVTTEQVVVAQVESTHQTHHSGPSVSSVIPSTTTSSSSMDPVCVVSDSPQPSSQDARI